MMSVIKEIDRQTVHQICSGQVILNLATAVKELLENSLDADATSIDIRLKEYGLTQVEVVDNGRGVEESNFEGLTLKHHTSKLQDFSDLTSVETFGFRGEALSSLSALCKMVITTRHKDTKVGYRLEYDSNGKILKKTCCARQPGTSVILAEIFHTLPVRHKEFKKNIKKEFAKLLALLNGYCLISTDVRISCTNETTKGNKTTVVSTAGAKTVLDNVSAVFGNKQCTSLLAFQQVEPSLEVCEAYFLKYEEACERSKGCTVSGFISSCGPGLGRSTTDRQFYSINKRPCELPKIGKVVNEVFHMFNRYQYPFVQLDVSTDREDVDVNVTPDKRQIFIQQEKLILAIVKTSLLSMFNEGHHAIGGMKQSILPLKPTCQLSGHTTQPKNCSRTTELANSDPVIPSDKRPGASGHPSAGTKLGNGLCLSQFCRGDIGSTEGFSTGVRRSSVKRAMEQTDVYITKQRKIETIFTSVKNDCEKPQNSADLCERPNVYPRVQTGDLIPCGEVHSSTCVTTDKPSEQRVERVVHEVQFSFSKLKQTLHKLRELSPDKRDATLSGRSFKAKIASEQNNEAEAELSRYFGKESFTNIDIIGQFNLGFVIARHGNDLFIIDQHAADEKYNFEELQKTTVLHGQPLIIPKKLELTAGDRLVMQENADVFQLNGFGFRVEKDEDSNQELIYLTKVPSSKNCVFDAKDVAELIFMLTDAPNTLCRPSSVRKMFASRACRKSIMVGTPLTCSEMKKIAVHMAEMDQPWNCPHGRPTMRHLVDLSMISGMKSTAS